MVKCQSVDFQIVINSNKYWQKFPRKSLPLHMFNLKNCKIMKVIYESKIAKIIIPTFSAILIFCWLLCKKTKEYYDEEFLKHEETHSYQWKSLMIPGTVLFSGLAGVFSCPWLLLLIPLTFYLYYALEWLVRVIGALIKYHPGFSGGFKKWIKRIQAINHDCYHAIVFEQEANAVEKGVVDYGFLSFFKYY